MEFLGFVPEPNCGRGTLGIIWNCLSTLFLAVWVACHTETLSPSSSGSWLYRKKLTSTALFLVFPELGALLAMQTLFYSIQLRREMRQIPKWDKFSLKQAFLVYCLKGLFRRGVLSRIDEEDFVSFALSSRLDPNDFPSNEEIDDRSKSSGVLKAISISQTLWFMVNVAWRLKSDYQVTPLEDLTVAHAFCGFIMFVAWFRCPQDIHRGFCVPVLDKPSGTPEGQATRAGRSYEPNVSASMAVMVVLFGIFTGIHLAAWNYPFATIPEAWIWRGCSIMIFVLGSLAAVFAFFNNEIEASTGRDLFVISLLLAGLYVFVRLALVVIAFMAFRHAPAGIYDKPTWSAYWAHLG